MKTKKKEVSVILEGAESIFDLIGSGLRRRRSNDNILVSWYNTGSFFSKALQDVKEREKNNLEFHSKKYHLQE